MTFIVHPFSYVRVLSHDDVTNYVIRHSHLTECETCCLLGHEAMYRYKYLDGYCCLYFQRT
jgi:hypothetical protein